VPFRGPGAETRGEAVEKLRGERNLRHQDQALPAAADRVRHRVEIDFGFSRTGDAVKERDRIAAGCHRLLQGNRRGALVGGEIRRDEIGIGRLRDRLGRQHHGGERAFVDEAVDHAGGNARLARGIGLAAHHAVGEKIEHAPARSGQALGRRARKPHADALAFGAEMLAHAQAHAQHHAASGQRVIRDPFDKPAQFRLERREFEPLLDVLEPIIEPRIRVGVLGPDHAGGLARPERDSDDVARRKLKRGRHAVGIGPIQRDRHQHIDHTSGHLVSRFRSSQGFEAPLMRTSESKEHQQSHDCSVVFGFEFPIRAGRLIVGTSNPPH